MRFPASRLLQPQADLHTSLLGIVFRAMHYVLTGRRPPGKSLLALTSGDSALSSLSASAIANITRQYSGPGQMSPPEVPDSGAYATGFDSDLIYSGNSTPVFANAPFRYSTPAFGNPPHSHIPNMPHFNIPLGFAPIRR